jgi:hypothetical protein
LTPPAGRNIKNYQVLRARRGKGLPRIDSVVNSGRSPAIVDHVFPFFSLVAPRTINAQAPLTGAWDHLGRIRATVQSGIPISFVLAATAARHWRLPPTKQVVGNHRRRHERGDRLETGQAECERITLASSLV